MSPNVPPVGVLATQTINRRLMNKQKTLFGYPMVEVDMGIENIEIELGPSLVEYPPNGARRRLVLLWRIIKSIIWYRIHTVILA